MTGEQDPIIAAIEAYKAGNAAYEAGANDVSTPEEDDALAASTWLPAYRQLAYETPKATTRAGAAAALRAALDEGDTCDDVTAPLMRAALAWLEGVSEQ
ncbi:hypothetical protein [Jiella sonneratiae]|uniref:Uncharacterized protein n=1 Tax=Jiella sonneratiae TaxID=2816856 RepID=A0ABS3J3X2_9HYPH|nr:hypothetical protein [Jiella sonneratiae]MBO0903820.1 hypothetical protein [Jiella sonneratiae]